MSSDEIKGEILKNEKLLESLKERLVKGEISEQVYRELKKEFEEKIVSLKDNLAKTEDEERKARIKADLERELKIKEEAQPEKEERDIVTYVVPKPPDDRVTYKGYEQTIAPSIKPAPYYQPTPASRQQELEKTPVEAAPATTPESAGVRRCIIKPFSLQGAEVKAKGDITPVADVFHRNLAAILAKKGIEVENMPTHIGPEDFVIEGRFVKINAGSRALRYVSGVGGGATIEVEGRVLQGNRQITDLYEKHYWWAGGIFGGSDEFVLKAGASVAAGKIAKQVLKALE